MSSSLTFQKVDNENSEKKAVSVYQIAGRIDPETAPEFETTMKIFQKQERYVILDFANVTYVNSFGIGILVDAQKNIVKNNGVIKICGLSPSIKKIFQITYLTRVFEIFDDVGLALESFEIKATNV